MPVEVTGALELRKGLKQFAPELAKESQREISGLLRSITNKAKGFVPSEAPLSGWASDKGAWGESTRRYDASEIKRGITFSAAPSKANKRGFRSMATIYNKSAAGAIYETAGRKNPMGQPPAKRTVAYRGGLVVPAWQSGKDINTSANPKAGKQFIDAMAEMYVAKRSQGQGGRMSRKMNGRLIFRAWGEDNGRVNAKVIQAIEKTVDKVLTITNGNTIEMKGR